MGKPDYAFQTSTHLVKETKTSGEFIAHPGEELLRFDLEAQHIPPAIRSEELERAAMSWVMARGGRSLNLDGTPTPIDPQQMDRPASGPVRRIVSLAPSNTEILWALGAMELLVAVDSGSDFPPEIASLPRLGSELHVDMEALAALQPDLVLAALSVPGMERNVVALERLGIPYLVFAPRSLEEIRQEILRIGGAIDRMEVAQAVAGEMAEKIAAARNDPPSGSDPVRVFLEWWPQPMFSPGRDCWSSEMIGLAGGVNVFGHLPVQSTEVSVSDVVAADPELIVISWCGVPMSKLSPERVLRFKGLEEVTAILHRRVYPIDESLLGRPGPRVFEGVAQLEKLIRGVRKGVVPPA